MTAPTLSLTSLNLPLLVTAATLYTTGGVLIKLSEGLTRPYSLLLVVAVTPGAALQALAVRHAQLSTCSCWGSRRVSLQREAFSSSAKACRRPNCSGSRSSSAASPACT